MPDTALVPSQYKIHLNLILFSMMKFTCYAEETFSILCVKKTYENLLNSVMKFTCYADKYSHVMQINITNAHRDINLNCTGTNRDINLNCTNAYSDINLNCADACMDINLNCTDKLMSVTIALIRHFWISIKIALVHRC